MNPDYCILLRFEVPLRAVDEDGLRAVEISLKIAYLLKIIHATIVRVTGVRSATQSKIPTWRKHAFPESNIIPRLLEEDAKIGNHFEEPLLDYSHLVLPGAPDAAMWARWQHGWKSHE